MVETVHSGEFTRDERAEIRGFFISLRHWRWLCSRLKVWGKWVGAVGGASLAFMKWSNEIIPAIKTMISLLGLGGLL